jgi:hypothetical protein
MFRENGEEMWKLLASGVLTTGKGRSKDLDRREMRFKLGICHDGVGLSILILW